MPTTSYIKNGASTWTAINQMYIRTGDGWRSIKEGWIRTDTEWVKFHDLRSSGDAVVGETAAGEEVWEFESSSTFVLTEEEEVRLLAIGGGGSPGGNYSGGGGGGGGITYEASTMLPPGEYTVTVGSGGNGNSVNGGTTTIAHIDGSTIYSAPGGQGGQYGSNSGNGGRAGATVENGSTVSTGPGGGSFCWRWWRRCRWWW